MRDSQNDRHCWEMLDVLPPLAEKEGSVAVTRGRKGTARDRWAAGGERDWRAEAKRKESGKVGQGHDGRTAGEGKESSLEEKRSRRVGWEGE